MDATNTTTDNTAAPQQPAQQPATDGAKSGSSNGATLTQEHFNAETGKARKEGRQSGVNDVLKKLGLTSEEEIEALKSTIEDARKRKEADMSEAEKAKAELEREKAAKTALEQRIAQIETERRTEKVTSAITGKAASLKANDADDVLRYAKDKHAEELAGLMDESGAIDDKKVTALLDKIKAAKPSYFTPMQQAQGSMSNPGTRIVQDTNKKPDISKYRI